MLSSAICENAIGGAVGGLVAAIVFAMLAAAYRYWRRPQLAALRCNLKISPAGVEYFDLVVTNTGETPFFEPTMNIDGLSSKAVFTTMVGASWTPEGKLILPYHKTLAAKVAIRITFQVYNRAELGDSFRVSMLHLHGIEPGPTIRTADMRTMR